MNETKRRGWIKNTVIIFLVILLILTLFSNTILNHSLPEVAVQYPQYATIASRIRQTGTVTANQSYDVTIEQTRTVASVEVRVGASVKKGDVLFRLEEGDSAELDQANKELANLQIQLIQKRKQDPSLNIGNGTSAVDSLKKQLNTATSTMNNIKDNLESAKEELALAQKELAKVEETQGKIPSFDEVLSAKNLLSQIDVNIEYLEEEIVRLKGKQGQIGGDGYFTPAEIEKLIADADKAVSDKEQLYIQAALAYDRAVNAQTRLETELKTANVALQNAKDAVAEQNNNVGGSTTMDALMKEMQSVQALKNELSALQTELNVFREAASYRSGITVIQNTINMLNSENSTLTNEIADIDRQLNDYRPQLSEIPALQGKIDTLESKKNTNLLKIEINKGELTKANVELATAQDALAAFYSSKGYYSMSYTSEAAYNQAISEKTLAYNTANQSYQKTYFEYLQSSQQNSILEKLTTAQKEAEIYVENVTESLAEAKTAAAEAKTACDDAEKALDAAKADLSKTQGYREYDELGAGIKDLQKQVDALKLQKTEAETVVNNASEDSKDKIASTLNDKKKLVKAAEKEITNLQNQLTEAQYNISDLNEQIGKAQAQAEIDDQNAKLDLKQYEIELKQISDQIAAKEEQILRLEENRIAGTVVSPVSGVVESLAVAAGQEAKANTPIASIILSDMGYTMQCTVTAEQAAKVAVGETAEIQWYYYGNTPTARVAAIKNDAASQGKNKIIVLDVTGDITPGTSLTFTLGSKNASYDCVVPNSAVREDADGKFILIVTAKSTPLGNRYSAKRVDVDVLASDETNSAVSGPISGEYVITNSTAPISAGMNVRLSED